MFLTLRKFFLKNHILILLAIIIFVSAFMRLYKIGDYMTFLGDEGRDVLVVREILQGDLTFLGPRASAGDFYLGPIYYYFMAPFLYLSSYHPVGPAVMVALFGIATVYLVYRLGKEFWDTKAGLIAAALYAISPLVISYSRSSWNPNILPFFSIITLYSAYLALKQNKNWLFIVSGISLGIALQLHYISTFLGVILGFYVVLSTLVGSNKDSFESLKMVLFRLLKLTIGFVLGFSPFLLFEIKNNFPNTRTIIDFIFRSGEVSGGGNFLFILGDVYFRVFSRLVTYLRPAELFPSDSSAFHVIWLIITLGLGVCSTLFILILLYKKVKEKDKNFPKYLFFPLWLLMGIILFGLYKKPIYDYYFGFMFPAPFLVVGVFISYLWDKGRLYMFFASLIIIALIGVNLSGFPFQYPPNKQYEQVKEIAEFILEQTGDKPFNFALLTGGNSDHGYRYIFEINDKPPTVIEFPGVDPERETITEQLFVVCEIGNCQPLGHSLWEVAGFGQAEIEMEWDVSVVKVYKLVHYEENQ